MVKRGTTTREGDTITHMYGTSYGPNMKALSERPYGGAQTLTPYLGVWKSKIRNPESGIGTATGETLKAVPR